MTGTARLRGCSLRRAGGLRFRPELGVRTVTRNAALLLLIFWVIDMAAVALGRRGARAPHDVSARDA